MPSSSPCNDLLQECELRELLQSFKDVGEIRLPHHIQECKRDENLALPSQDTMTLLLLSHRYASINNRSSNCLRSNLKLYHEEQQLSCRTRMLFHSC